MTSGRATSPDRIVFHPGLRKCGSSTIQAWLRANAGTLAEDGIFVSARDDLTKAWRHAAASWVVSGGDPAAERRLRDEIARCAEVVSGMGAPVVVVSDENLVGNRVSAPDGSTLVDWSCRIADWMHTAFAPVASDVTAVFYTRDVDRWMRSAWHQAVARKGETRPFAIWRAEEPAPDFAMLRQRLAREVSMACQVVEMEGEVASGSALGSAILRAAGLDEGRLAVLVPTPRQNASLPDNALNVIRLFNHVKAGRLAHRVYSARRNGQC